MNETIQMEDEELARAAQRGDMAAFEALLSRHETRLFSFLRQMTGSSHDAEDIAQTVWVGVYRQLHRFDPARSFSTWLFSIARNTAISSWRKKKNDALEVRDHDWVDRAHPGESGFQREEAENIWIWVSANLKGEQRDALWMMYRENMGVRDIARALNCSVVRLKVMLHRARKKLLRAHEAQPVPGFAAVVKCGGET